MNWLANRQGWVAIAVAWMVAAGPAMGQVDPESVYAPPTLVLPEEQVNEGGVRFDMRVAYMSDYMFRGVHRFPFVDESGNMQFDGLMRFDLDRLPHPFVGVFVNVAGRDPISELQEIRPYLGFDWQLRPLTLSAGHTSYIHPHREHEDTTEVWGQLTLDDSFIWDSDDPVLRPYLFAAYDYRRYNGWYMELGVSHDFVIPDTGIVLTARGHVAYVRNHDFFTGVTGRNSGFPHYQVGLVASYTLNTLLNVPQRYGDWRLEGYLFYSEGIEQRLRADRELWGGAGLGFRY